MKRFVLFILWAFVSIDGYSQGWPVTTDANHPQGNVFGTAGEYRPPYTTAVTINGIYYPAGRHRFHEGTDMTGLAGRNEVIAINAGTVKFESSGWNRRIIINNVIYWHTKELPTLHSGDNVNAGDTIGTHATGGTIHLHLQSSGLNFLNGRLTPFADGTSPTIKPENVSNNIYRFLRNGYNFNTTNSANALTDNINGHRLLYNKLDVVLNTYDDGISNNTLGSLLAGYHLGIQEVKYEVLKPDFTSVDRNEEGYTFDNTPFDLVNGPVAVFGYGSTSGNFNYILTSSPYNAPFERFWNTRLKAGVTENWSGDMSNDASVNDEAHYKDGKYKIRFRSKDYINRQTETLNDILIDNFRPYVKSVEIKGGKLNYKATWKWEAASGQLVIEENKSMSCATGEIFIKVLTSEPMNNLKLEIPTLSVNKTGIVVDPLNPVEWKFKLEVAETNDKPAGLYKLVISGKDLANNSLQGFTSKANVPGSSIPKRNSDGTWSPSTAPVNDNIHEFRIGSQTGEVTVSTTNASGCNKQDGKATIAGTTTNQQLEYAVDGGAWQSSNEFTDLAIGDHQAKVRVQGEECESSKDFTINEKDPLIVNISGLGTTEFCNNANPPKITLTATAIGGSGNFDYSWPGGSITVSSSGRHSVTVTDKETGCTESLGGHVIFVPIICSRDPNDIIGPEGYEPGKMIAKSKAHLYMIRFENDPDFATAPAQVVKINHPLDGNVNPFSLRLGDFGFAGLTFAVPADKTFYSTRLNLIDSLGIVVDVTAGINAVKKEAFWVFESKDPATGLPPDNSNLGFLPVNDSSAKGEGYVTYTIKAANHTVTGDSIHAKASIVFDINAAIETPVIYNTIDAVAPISKVSGLPEISDSATIFIKWTGSDDPGGSGIRDYDLYVSKNGGVFSIYQSGITDSATNFTGSPGNTYSFYTLATDNTGNAEASKSAGEQTITIRQAGAELVFYRDADNDGYGNLADTVHAVDSPIGYVSNGTDCDDTKASVHPGATEVCNGIDDNCDGQIDEGVQSVFYRDADGDGYGNASDTVHACSAPVGYITDSTDCDDTKKTVHPGATEICNGIDDNCDGQIDEGVQLVFYHDADNDGYGNSADTIHACVALVGYVIDSTDCNDNDASVHEGCELKPPFVIITTPANNAIYRAPAKIKINATASDADGMITKVEFYKGTTLLNTETDAPYDCIITDAQVGSYSITAKATDNDGNVSTSDAVNITVIPDVAPTVNITSPVNGATFTAPANIVLSANAIDPDGRIVTLDFYNGSTLIFTETAAPYSRKWFHVPVGNYSITARATDNNGVVTTSAPVNISVVPNLAPMVKITSPTNGKSYTAPATIELSADASDADGIIRTVDFYNGNTLLFTEKYFPYFRIWPDVPEGNYSITAKATDNNGKTTTSAPVAISVGAASNQSASGGKLNFSDKPLSLSLNPNPANKTLNISVNGLPANNRSTISILSASGVVVKTIQSNALNKILQLDISTLTPGNYTIKVISRHKVLHKQFIKL